MADLQQLIKNIEQWAEDRNLIEVLHRRNNLLN